MEKDLYLPGETMREPHYILKGKEVVACELDQWVEMFSKGNRILRQDRHYGILISTVFLGIDHSFHKEGPPVVFETMIFGGRYSDYQERYTTWDEAMEGHWRALTLVIESAHLWDIILSPVRMKIARWYFKMLYRKYRKNIYGK